jgi:hypothetical protein
MWFVCFFYDTLFLGKPKTKKYIILSNILGGDAVQCEVEGRKGGGWQEDKNVERFASQSVFKIRYACCKQRRAARVELKLQGSAQT